MTQRFLFGLPLAAAVMSAASCGTTSFHSSAAAPVSDAGVQLAVTSKRCYISRTGEQYPTPPESDRLNLDVRLQVRNDSGRPVVVSRDRMVIEGQNEAELRPQQSGEVPVAPGETKVLALAYEQDGALDCNRPFELETEGAVQLDGQPLRLQPIPLTGR